VPFIYVLGPAGSGKTTLVNSFGKFLESEGYSVGYVNLDCAVEELPYRPDFDVRSWFTIVDIMKVYGLGPNGAMVKSIELIVERLSELKKAMYKLEFEKTYVLVDTPGQLETVIFHTAGPTIFKKLAGMGIGLFLLPGDLLKSARDFVFLTLLALAVKYRLDIPLVRVFSKTRPYRRTYRCR
jgi:GTPase SAR1 and related small G proteins